MGVCPSICLRMDSTEACERKNRFVRALSSLRSPRRRCSVSMYGEPNWLASYRAKNMTRLAFSVYLSNIVPSPNPGGRWPAFYLTADKRCLANIIGQFALISRLLLGRLVPIRSLVLHH